MANELEIKYFVEEEDTFDVTVKDSNKVIFPLTGYSMKLYIKTNRIDSDATALVTKTATISAPLTGIGTFELTTIDLSMDAGTYYYNVKIDNDSDIKKVVLYGAFIMDNAWGN